ncbi:hypothetical protein GCM10009736_28750 [Actinomadura bangladeshensis]
MNENGCPQLRQNPSVRPGLPPRLRPTFSSQRLQKRRFSGTSGFSMIADAGSRAGTGGTSTSPAPSIPRLVEPLDPVPRVPPRDAVRPDPTVPRPLPAELPDVPPGPSRPAGPGSLAVGGAKGVCRVTGAGVGASARAGTRTGAALVYPARAAASGPTDTAGSAVPDAAARAGGTAGAGSGAGAMPQTSQNPSASMAPVQPGWVHRFIAASPSRSRSP